MEQAPENKMQADPENKARTESVPAGMYLVRCQCGELVGVRVTEAWHRCKNCFGKVFWPPTSTRKGK